MVDTIAGENTSNDSCRVKLEKMLSLAIAFLYNKWTTFFILNRWIFCIAEVRVESFF